MMNSSFLRNSSPAGMSPDDDRPNFAVIRLKPESNLPGLFQLLLCNGFGEVAFVKNLNDCNFGGNREASTAAMATSTTSAAVQQHNNGRDGASFENELCNGFSSAPRKSNILEDSIQKLIDAKKQRLAAAKVAGMEKSNADRIGGQSSAGSSGAGARKSISQSGGTRPDDASKITDQLYSNVMQNSEPLSTDQKSFLFDKSQSPLLPLSTFTCPLPLPVDRPALNSSNQKSIIDSVQKKSIIPAPMKNAGGQMGSITPKTLPIPPTATASITSTRPILERTSGKEVSQLKHSRSPAGTQIFVQCHLCQSKIMATRFSNLTNHVRRHAPMKQFQCIYCDYAHNEIAKVRLHMTNNHNDKDSRPLNKVTAEMQETWRQLMRECFPERSKRQKAPRPPPPPEPNQSVSATAIISEKSALISQKSTDRSKSDQNRSVDPKKSIMAANSLNYSALEEEDDSDDGYQFGGDHDDQIDNNGKIDNDGAGHRFARCDQCYAYVDVNMKESHVRACHMENVPSITHVCSICGLENIDQRQLEIHIQIEHDPSDQAEIQTVDADLTSYINHLIEEYFPLDTLEYTSNFEKISAGNSNGNIDFDSILFNGEHPFTATPGEQIGDQYPNTPKSRVDRRSIDDQANAGADRSGNDHGSATPLLTCNICQRQVNRQNVIKHAQKHLVGSTTAYECPICKSYQSGAIERVRRHLLKRHQGKHGNVQPKIVRSIRIPTSALENAISGAVKRCFGLTGAFGYKKKNSLRKPTSIIKGARKNAKV